MPSESPQSTAPRPPLQASITDTCAAWAYRHRWWVLAFVLAFYLLAFNGQWRATPDTGLHLSIARNLAAGNGFVHPLGDEVRANPGLSHLLAATMRVVGPEQLWLADLVMLGLGLGTLGLAFLWFQLNAGRHAAVLLTAMLGLSVTFFQYAFHLLADMPFLFGAMLFLVGWDRLMRHRGWRWADLLLLVAGTGVMVAFRTVAITFLGAVVLALAWHIVRSGDRRLWWAGGVLAALCVAGLFAAILTSHAPPAEDGPHVRPDTELIVNRLTNLGEVAREEVPTNVARLLQEQLPRAVMGVNLGPVANLPVGLLALGLGLGLAVTRRHVLGGLLVLAFVVQTLLFIVVARYYLAVLPVLLLGWWYGAAWVERRWGEGGRWLCIAMLVVWIVPNVVRSGNFIIQQRQTPFLEHHADGRYASILDLRDRLREPNALPADSVIITDHRDLHVMVYLTMPLDVAVVSRRHARPMARTGAPLYVLDPVGDELAPRLERWGWELGEPVLEVPARAETPALRIRPVRVAE